MSALTALEFYSGIGGMHAALKMVRPAAVVLAAFDINQSANLVYEQNFGRLVKQTNLEHITAEELDSYAADLWLLAPPCQPFTRQGKQLGAQDKRSCSLINILNQLTIMQRPPSWLLIENVVGFELSDMHKQLIMQLAVAGYQVQEFKLTPLQYGVPYSRPSRYFCLSSRCPFPAQLPADCGPCLCTPALLLKLTNSQTGQQALEAAARQHMASHVRQVQSISQCLGQHQPLPQQVEELAAAPAPLAPAQQPPPLQPSCSAQSQTQQHFHGCQCGSHQQQHSQLHDAHAADWVPSDVIDKYAEVIDVVSLRSRSCNCFTKAYGKFARGAGSLLATNEPAGADIRWQLVGGTGSLYYQGYPNTPADWKEQTHQLPDGASSWTSTISTETCSSSALVPCTAMACVTANCSPGATDSSVITKQDLAQAWKRLRLRYFTPSEIARLHSLPSSFSFPQQLTPRQCYKLLGNSLSVVVVADLLDYLLSS